MALFNDSSFSRLHFLGICGTAMAAVAAELHRAGFEVTGSDSNVYPPMSDFLHEQGVDVREGYKPDNLPSDALIVVGNALSRGNPELEAAMDRCCVMISLPELISRRYLTGKCSIVVAGTHGKTTTTSMIAHILRCAGRDPGWMLGGIPIDLESPCWMGSGGEFVIEGDEYDSVWFDKRPKFFHYQPRIAVLTSVEFDHSDIYPDLKAVEEVFRRFTRLLPRSGKLIVCGDFPRALTVSRDALCSVETYGSSAGCDWRIRDMTEPGQEGLRGEFDSPDGLSGSLELGFPGGHNLKNGLAALAVAHAVGVDIPVATLALSNFRGVRRRLELLMDYRGIAVWEDFAHHPTAVGSTLEGLRNRYPDRRLWALLEPRSNTMARNFFTTELTDVLALADRVILGPVHRRERIPADERLDARAVAEALRKRSVEASAAESFDEVVETVVKGMKCGDVIVIMSNGGFGDVKERIMDSIRRMKG